jgi:plastocyanin
MKRLLALALVLVAATAAVALPALAATKTVTIGDNFFKPTRLSVTAGTSVVWRWTGRNPHNVTVTGGPQRFHSKTQTSGTFTATPRAKGTYSIICTIHRFKMTMVVR